MNKNKVIVISIMGLVVMIIFLVLYKTFTKGKSKENEHEVTGMPSAKAQDKFTYKDMMQYREDNLNNQHNDKTKINVDEQEAKGDTLNFKIAGVTEGLNFEEEKSNPVALKETALPVIKESKPVRPNTYSGGNSAGYNSPQREPRKKDLYNVEEYKNVYAGIKNQTAEVKQPETPVSELAQPRKRREGFVGSKGNVGNTSGGIAVISFGDQLIESGGSMKMRVTNESTLNGVQIPRNSIVYGTVSKGQNRLNINVSAVQVGGRSIPVQLVAYDAKDGMAGLKVTQQEVNNESESVKRSAGDEIMNATGVTSLPIIGNLTRGARDLLSRKKSNNAIVVTDNYQLILR